MAKTKYTDEDLLELIQKSLFLGKKFKEQYQGILIKGLFNKEQKDNLYQILQNEKKGLKKIFENPKYETLRGKLFPVTKEMVWEECKKTLVEKVNSDKVKEEEVKYLIQKLRELIQNTKDKEIRDMIVSISDRFEPLKRIRETFEMKEQNIIENVIQNFIGIIMEEKGMDAFEEIRVKIQEETTEDYIPFLMNKYPKIFNKACNGR